MRKRAVFFRRGSFHPRNELLFPGFASFIEREPQVKKI
jgi:hypothetical protein